MYSLVQSIKASWTQRVSAALLSLEAGGDKTYDSILLQCIDKLVGSIVISQHAQPLESGLELSLPYKAVVCAMAPWKSQAAKRLLFQLNLQWDAGQDFQQFTSE